MSNDTTKNKEIHINSFDNSNDTTITVINNYDNILTNGSNLIINNSLFVPLTKNNNSINTHNSNTLIALKDRRDGDFKSLFIEDNDLYIHPSNIYSSSLSDISNNKKLILRQDDLENEINKITGDLEFSNIHINRTGGYINFYDSNINLNNQVVGIGLRVDSGVLQFKKTVTSTWSDFSASGGSSGLDNVVDDPIPQLGGTLDTNSQNISFNTTSNIVLASGNNNLHFVDNTGNVIVEINDSNTSSNHLVFTTRNFSGSDMPEICVDGDTNVDLRLKTRGNGDLYLDTNGATSGGDIIITTSNIDINDMNNLNISTGEVNLTDVSVNLSGDSYIVSSLQFIENANLSTNSLSPASITCQSDTLIFDISGNNGTFYAEIQNGNNGQNANLIFDTDGNNNTVEVSFAGTGNVGVGVGMAKKLIYTQSGQSTSMIYLQFSGDASRNRWQVLNTGCSVSD